MVLMIPLVLNRSEVFSVTQGLPSLTLVLRLIPRITAPDYTEESYGSPFLFITMTASTFKTDTELSAVNQVLGRSVKHLLLNLITLT